MSLRFAVLPVLAFALCLPLRAQERYEPAPGETVDEKMDVVIRPEAPAAETLEAKAGGTTCSLSFSPPSVTNSQTSHYSVVYGGTGCVSGQIAETVTLNWASGAPGFGELTVRKKMLTITRGCLGSSGELVVAPTAYGIHGTVTARVEVRDWTGSTLFCTATGTLTVN